MDGWVEVFDFARSTLPSLSPIKPAFSSITGNCSIVLAIRCLLRSLETAPLSLSLLFFPTEGFDRDNEEDRDLKRQIAREISRPLIYTYV